MAHDRITSDPKVMMGKPVIKGTRVPVGTIVRWLDKGVPVEELMVEFDLNREDILAAQSYASKLNRKAKA